MVYGYGIILDGDGYDDTIEYFEHFDFIDEAYADQYSECTDYNALERKLQAGDAICFFYLDEMGLLDKNGKPVALWLNDWREFAERRGIELYAERYGELERIGA